MGGATGESGYAWAFLTATERPRRSWLACATPEWSAPLVIDGPINGEWFEAYVAQVLVPTLKPGDVVILDNLSSHKRPAAREMIKAAGARMVFLPPYSPDFNPIEKAFSKLKALLRKAAERTVSGLWDRIGQLIEFVEPQEARNFFNSCGYDPI